MIVTRRPPDEDRETSLDGPRTKLGVGPSDVADDRDDQVDLVGTIVGA